MRHDPASAAVVVMLRSLKMYGMAQAVSDLTEQGAPAFDTAVPILSQLLKADLVQHDAFNNRLSIELLTHLWFSNLQIMSAQARQMVDL